MKRIKILIIGKKSFLTKHYLSNSKLKNIDVVNRNLLSKKNLDDYSHILNFSLDAKNKTHNYNLTNKLDKKICELIKGKEIIYVLPSTRLVYGNSKTKKYKESKINTKNQDIYAINKKKIENEVLKLRKKNYLILRISTILAYDYFKRPLFITRALRNLKRINSITIDLEINTYKDFITIEMLSQILDKLINKKITGIFNLSSGIPIKVNDLAMNILKGYGKGKIIYKKKLKKNKSFLLNNSKLKKKIKFNISKKYILNYGKNLGKKLINA